MTSQNGVSIITMPGCLVCGSSISGLEVLSECLCVTLEVWYGQYLYERTCLTSLPTFLKIHTVY